MTGSEQSKARACGSLQSDSRVNLASDVIDIAARQWKNESAHFDAPANPSSAFATSRCSSRHDRLSIGRTRSWKGGRSTAEFLATDAVSREGVHCRRLFAVIPQQAIDL
jgi:hypothetical protein